MKKLLLLMVLSFGMTAVNVPIGAKAEQHSPSRVAPNRDALARQIATVHGEVRALRRKNPRVEKAKALVNEIAAYDKVAGYLNNGTMNVKHVRGHGETLKTPEQLKNILGLGRKLKAKIEKFLDWKGGLVQNILKWHPIIVAGPVPKKLPEPEELKNGLIDVYNWHVDNKDTIQPNVVLQKYNTDNALRLGYARTQRLYALIRKERMLSAK